MFVTFITISELLKLCIFCQFQCYSVNLSRYSCLHLGSLHPRILSNQSSCLTMSAINVKHKQPLKENHIFQNGLIESDKSFHVIFFFLFWSFCFLLVEWHTLQFAATKRNWILKIFLTFWYVCLQSSGKEKFELIYTSMASKMF